MSKLQEPIQNALYATGKFLPEECMELAEGIEVYINEHLESQQQEREVLASYTKWLYHRNLNDDSMSPEDWVDVYLATKTSKVK